MKNYNTIIAIVLSGILAVSAQARPNELAHKGDRAPSAMSQKKGKVQSHAKSRARVQYGPAAKRVAKLPRNLKRVAHRGVTYYVSNGVCYRPTRGGYVSVRRPW